MHSWLVYLSFPLIRIMYQVLFSDAYGLQTRFAIDNFNNFNVGNEAHAVQDKTRLKLLQVSRSRGWLDRGANDDGNGKKSK